MPETHFSLKFFGFGNFEKLNDSFFSFPSPFFDRLIVLIDMRQCPKLGYKPKEGGGGGGPQPATSNLKKN